MWTVPDCGIPRHRPSVLPLHLHLPTRCDNDGKSGWRDANGKTQQMGDPSGAPLHFLTRAVLISLSSNSRPSPGPASSRPRASCYLPAPDSATSHYRTPHSPIALITQVAAWPPHRHRRPHGPRRPCSTPAPSLPGAILLHLPLAFLPRRCHSPVVIASSTYTH